MVDTQKDLSRGACSGQHVHKVYTSYGLYILHGLPAAVHVFVPQVVSESMHTTSRQS